MPGQLITDSEFVALQELAQQALGGACQIERATSIATPSGGRIPTWANLGSPVPYALTLPSTPSERQLADQVAPQTLKVMLLPAGTIVQQETDRLSLDTGEIYHVIGPSDPTTYEVLRRVSVVLAPLQGTPS